MATQVDATIRADEARLVPLGTLWAKFGGIHTLEGAPFGTRVIADVVDFRMRGERVSGGMAGTATADWGTAGRDGVFQLDVRGTMKTDDGALVLVQYGGRCDVSAGFEAAGPVYATPRFETGDERYLWLNKIQAVLKGALDMSKGEITYRMYELR